MTENSPQLSATRSAEHVAGGDAGCKELSQMTDPSHALGKHSLLQPLVTTTAAIRPTSSM